MGLNVVKKVRICEVGLRDGLQNEKTLLTTEQKLDLLQKLTDAGFPVIEVGSFVSPKAVPQVANTDEVFQNFKQKKEWNTGPSLPT